MTDDVQPCGAVGVHPELGELVCTEDAGHEPPHKAPAPDGDGALEWTDDEPGEHEHGPTFDLNAFVKNLPDGVVLCPLCLGMGGVVEEPPFDPTTHRCTTCDGRGNVRTGSLVSDQAERKCGACEGRGWQHNDPTAPPAGPARAADFASGTPRDSMGRTPDDADFDWTSVVRDVEPVPATESV